MSGDAIKAWRKQVTREMLTQACLSVPQKRRPSTAVVDQVGLYLAVSLRDSKGFADETEQQIVDGLHGTLSVSSVGDALHALRAIWVPVKRGAKGSGTRRVFVLHDPHGLLNDLPPQRDYPAEITTYHNGKTMPPQRESDLSERGYPVAPERNLNTDPPASAEAGLCSPDSSAQPTPPCGVCADATDTLDHRRTDRLVNAVQIRRQPRTVNQERLRKAARTLLAHYPNSTQSWLIDVLLLWEPLSLALALQAHDQLLRLARQTPNTQHESAAVLHPNRFRSDSIFWGHNAAPDPY